MPTLLWHKANGLPNERSIQIYPDKEYWQQIRALGGLRLEQFLRSISSPCMTWHQFEPVIYINTNMEQNQFPYYMAEELLHASGLRTPLQVPSFQAMGRDVAREVGRGAMEKLVVYLGNRVNTGFNSHDLSEVPVNLQGIIGNAGYVGLILEQVPNYDPNIFARMCVTGNIAEFAEVYDSHFQEVGFEGPLSPSEQIIFVSSLLHQYEELHEGDPRTDALENKIRHFLGKFS